VGVGDADDADGFHIWRWQSGRTTEAEEQLVKWIDEGDERRGDKVVWEGTTVIWIGGHGGASGERGRLVGCSMLNVECEKVLGVWAGTIGGDIRTGRGSYDGLIGNSYTISYLLDDRSYYDRYYSDCLS
jgi:hypothetical protein